MREGKPWFWAAILLYCLACRLLPWALAHLGMPLDPDASWYPWNFAPMTAVTLLCGTGMTNGRWAFVLPLAVRAAGDVGIGWLTGNWDWAFPPDNLLTYGCMVFTTWLGMHLRHQPRWTAALPLAVLGEVVFFVVSNFGVWWLGEGLSHYPPTMAGLWWCYTAALPFFGRSLLSTLVFTRLLYSPVALRMAGIVPVEDFRAEVAVAP